MTYALGAAKGICKLTPSVAILIPFFFEKIMLHGINTVNIFFSAAVDHVIPEPITLLIVY